MGRGVISLVVPDVGSEYVTDLARKGGAHVSESCLVECQKQWAVGAVKEPRNA